MWFGNLTTNLGLLCPPTFYLDRRCPPPVAPAVRIGVWIPVMFSLEGHSFWHLHEARTGGLHVVQYAAVMVVLTAGETFHPVVPQCGDCPGVSENGTRFLGPASQSVTPLTEQNSLFHEQC